MAANKEPLPEQARSDIRSIYYFACGGESIAHMARLLASLPAKDHVDLLRSLFFDGDQPDSGTIAPELCLARFEEQADLRKEALNTYRHLQKRLSPRDAVWPLTQSAVTRLSRDR
jgi:hypothetical protein